MEDNVLSELVIEFLHEIGYRAEALEDGSVGSSASGLKFAIQSYGDSLQFRCVLLPSAENVDWSSFVNKFNTDIRFIKLYTMPEDTLVAEGDYLIDAESENALSRFRIAMEMWEATVSELKQRLNALTMND